LRGHHCAPASNGYGGGIRAGDWGRDDVRELILLAHPDRHPPERAALANKVTARLNALMERYK
jgi:hypothetical protein